MNEDKPIRNGLIVIAVLIALSAAVCAQVSNGRGPIPPEYRR